MPTTPRYFLVEDGQRTGPHSLAVLRQKADIHVLTPNTPISSVDTPETWTPLRDSALYAELFPNRPRYTLGAHAIERVNADNIPAPLSVPELLRANSTYEKAAEKQTRKQNALRTFDRWRDYAILILFGNVLAALAWEFLPAARTRIVPLLAFVVIYNIGVLWFIFSRRHRR